MKFLRGFLSFIAFLLCIVLFVASIATMLVADVRVITAKDNLKTIINQMITGSLSSNNNAASLAAGSVIFWEEESEENSELMDTLVESVYEMLSQQYGSEVPFTQEEVAEFVKESTLPEFISDKAADIITDIYNGELTTTITSEEIKELIEDNKALIEDTLDVEISNEMVDMVTDWVEKNDVTEKVQEQISQIVGIPVVPETPETPIVPAPGVTGKPVVGVPDPDDEKQEEGGIVGDVTTAVTNIKELINAIKNGESVSLPTVLKILRSVTTKNMLIACIGACLVLMLLIFLCKLDRWYAALRNCGVVYLSAGIILLTPVVAAPVLPMLFGNNPYIPLVRLIINMTLPVSGGVAVGGLVMIIAGSISGCVVRRSARKKIAAAATPVVAPVYVPVAAPVAAPAPAAQPAAVPVAPVSNHCKVCGTELSEDSLFCIACGSLVAQAAEEAPAEPVGNRCKVCDAELFEDSLFCGACGSPVETPAEKAVEEAAEEAIEEIPEEVVEEPVDVTAEEPAGNRCKICGAELFEDSLFCGECGSPVEKAAEENKEKIAEEPAVNRCTVCGAELLEGSAFCSACGSPVETAAEESSEETAEVPVEAAAAKPVDNRCKVCGAKLFSYDLYCSACGSYVEK